MLWDREILDLRVLLDALVDVLERRRASNRSRDREAQSHGLVWLVVGVLPNNNHFELTDRNEFKGAEDQIRWWVDLSL